MTKNPFINALAAAAYIVLVVFVINFVMRATKEQEETILIPMLMISMFTLSAAVMGYVFLSRPLQMYLEGEKKPAVSLFLKTVATFAVIVLLILSALFSGFFS